MGTLIGKFKFKGIEKRYLGGLLGNIFSTINRSMVEEEHEVPNSDEKQVNDGLEVWFDSSPLIFDEWVKEFSCKPEEKKKALQRKLSEVYKPYYDDPFQLIARKASRFAGSGEMGDSHYLDDSIGGLCGLIDSFRHDKGYQTKRQKNSVEALHRIVPQSLKEEIEYYWMCLNQPLRDRFGVDDFAHLLQWDVPVSLANSYHSSFDSMEIALLSWSGCQPEYANVFRQRWAGHDNSLNRFSIFSIIRLNEERLSHKEIFLCGPDASLDDILRIYKKTQKEDTTGPVQEKPAVPNAVRDQEMPASHVKAHPTPSYWIERIDYDKCFDRKQRETLIRSNYPPEMVQPFVKTKRRFDEMMYFLEKGILAEQIEGIPPQAKPGDIVEFYKEAGRIGLDTKTLRIADYQDPSQDIPATLKPLYQKIMSPSKMAWLYSFFRGIFGSEPSSILTKDEKRKLSLVERLVKSENLKLEDLEKRIIVGTESFLLHDGQRLWKHSGKVQNEYTMIKRIFQAHYPDEPEHIMKVIGTPIHNLKLEIENIRGETLFQKLQRCYYLDSDEVLYIAAHVVEGLCEMRKAKVFHNDLHYGNIMIAADTGRVVIIDLGEASTNRFSGNPNNRLFGGNNDLISLGQLVYRMAVGKNLFRYSPGLSINLKDEAKVNREETYKKPGELQRCFDSVRETVKDPFIADVIVFMLDGNISVQPTKNVYTAREMLCPYRDNKLGQHLR